MVDPHELRDLEVFTDVDAPGYPEMVVIPKGEFLMGSPESDTWGYANERPQHRVVIGYRFALGRYLVTVGEYCLFVDETGHPHEGGMYVWTGSQWKWDKSKKWCDPGFAQTDRHPVVGVSRGDAAAYSEWLSSKTGASEAEWEYACRAGTTTRYSFGDAITDEQANFHGKKGKTTEVGAYPANPWGLSDMHGNVWEWVEDVWHDSYEGAPIDGVAWTGGEGKESSSYRVVRGGSWDDVWCDVRSAILNGVEPVIRSGKQGFRVARKLEEQGDLVEQRLLD